METKEALKILRELVNTGNTETQTIKALNRAISSLAREEERENNKPTNAFRAWTRAEETQICEEVRQGMNFDDIAKKHNRTVGAIAVRLVRLGKITTAPEQSNETPFDPQEEPELEMAGDDEATANSYNTWTTDEDAQIIKEFHQFVNFNEMAARHKRSRGAIISRLVKLGKIKPKVA